ncbi:acyl carrier protein [Flavobacterium dankookense]|uniref:Acyl carrier protein n=1 Tax=Flavobacterium dankookense TaxID=706186 RepID=A0A4V3CSL4_9FLAO|nr:phosphopantetheine-binding protein [Flavobacterium dankookense]TDP61032.1 acyl carrier protein [Flavobacterium dankookense]
MTNSEIIEKLKLIVKPFVQDQNAFENLTESTDFLTDLKINSANLVDIVLDIEDAFGIEIDNQSMEKMLNIQATLDIIETKLAQK